MSWPAMPSQQLDGSAYCVSKTHALKHAIATQQDCHPVAAAAVVNPDAVDPVLLYAKLEVVKLELDAKRRSAREQGRLLRETQQAAACAKEISQAGKAFSKRQREIMRRSLPAGAEYMADGKPVYNTAKILAALNTDQRDRSIAHGPVHQDDTDRKAKRKSHEPTTSARWVGHDSDEDEAHQPTRTKRDSVLQRRPKADEPATVKLVPTKHGSQTVYEKVEMPRSELLEEDDANDTDNAECARPRLSRHDRPDWAQQSQYVQDTSFLKHIVQSARRGGSRPMAEMPACDEVATMLGGNGIVHAAPHRQRGRDTLVADAVSQIKREQRSKRWSSVHNLFKRASMA